RKRARGRGARGERLEGGRGGGTKRRTVLETHPRLDDDAENALRADEQTIGARPRARAGKASGRDHPGRRHDAQRFHELVHVGVERRVVAARAGGDPAPEGRELERLREVAEGERMRTELVLERGPEDAGLDARRARGAIDLEDAIEVAEVERHDAGVPAARGRFDATDDARAAAVRNGDRPRARAPVEHGDDVRFVARKGDDVGRAAEVTTDSPD